MGWCKKLSSIKYYERNEKRTSLFFLPVCKRTGYHWYSEGKKLSTFLNSKTTIAEGAYTVKAIKNLSKKLKMNLPINDAIYKILYLDKNINHVISDLLNRPIIKEN